MYSISAVVTRSFGERDTEGTSIDDGCHDSSSPRLRSRRRASKTGPRSGEPSATEHASIPIVNPPMTPRSLHLTASPVVELNRAIAVPRPRAPEAGLRIVDRLGLDDFRYLHSTKGELLRRLGRMDEARDAYRRARELTDDGAERRFIERRLTELATTGSG
jgi:hypothetical protein